VKTAIQYSEAFKKQVVDEIARGKFSSAYRAQMAYGIGGRMTVTKWIRKYGREDLLPKRIRIETMEEIDQLKDARKRIRELDALSMPFSRLPASGWKPTLTTLKKRTH